VNLAATLFLDNKGFLGPVDGSLHALGRLKGSIGSILGPLALLTAAMGAAAGAAALVKKGVDEAARMEDAETSFVTLLGSVSKAKERIADLSKFAATTPFELNEVVSASRLLQAFTGDALATGKGLRLVGDQAAAVGQPLEAVTMWMGRLYAGLKDGQKLGEPLQNLTQLGLITGTVRKQLQAVEGQALTDAKVMDVLTAAFGRNSGAMERLSRTYNGLMSTLRDAITANFRALGEPVRDALKPALVDSIAYFESLEPKARRVGVMIASVIDAVRQGLKEGRLDDLAGAALKLGFAEATNFLSKSLIGVLTGAITFLSDTEVWKSVGIAIKDAVVAGVKGFGPSLWEAIKTSPQQAYFERMFEPARANPVPGAVGRALEAGRRAAENTGGIDTGALRAEFTALFTELADRAREAREKAAREAEGGTTTPKPTPPPTTDALKKGSGGRDIDFDRLAKIGLFIGGAGGPAVDLARRTADNTGRLVQLTQKILNAGAWTTAGGASWA
jgi:hypothetical protein